MKKIVCIILIVLMIITLVACGNKEDKEVATPSKGEENTGALYQAEEYIEEKVVEVTDIETGWTINSELVLPEVTDMEERQMKIETPYGSREITGYKSPIDLSIERVKAIIDSNKTFNDLYSFKINKDESINYNKTEDLGDVHNYYISNALIGQPLDNDNRLYMKVYTEQDTSYYLNNNRIVIALAYLNSSNYSVNQEEIFDLCKDIFGENIGKYLVYAATNDISLDMQVICGNCVYILYRDVFITDDIINVTIRFEAISNEIREENIGLYNYNSMYNELDYHLSDTLSCGEINSIEQIEELVENIDKIVNGESENNLPLINYIQIRYSGDDVNKTYSLVLNGSYLQDYSFNINYKVNKEIESGLLNSIYIEINGGTKQIDIETMDIGTKVNCYKTLYSNAIEQIRYLYPEISEDIIDINSINTNNLDNIYTGTFNKTIFGYSKDLNWEIKCEVLDDVFLTCLWKITQ